jgi:hypothetical protein
MRVESIWTSNPSPITAKLVANNFRRDGRTVTVWLEPLGEDYTLLAGESLEIIATGRGFTPWFDVGNVESGLSVVIEGGPQDFVVYQNGRQLLCGHNRDAVTPPWTA